MKTLKNLSLFVFSILFSQEAFSHGDGHRHHPQGKAIQETPTEESKFRKINNLYGQTVRPIFEKKCFDCHGGTTHYPWYYAIPGANQLIDHDIEEAKEHMDMSNGFPFAGHGSPEEDLKAIQDSIDERNMPPLQYWILHWGSRLTKDEAQKVRDWVTASEAILR